MRISQGEKTRDFQEGTILIVKKCQCVCHTHGALHIQECCDNGYYVEEIGSIIPSQVSKVEKDGGISVAHFFKDWSPTEGQQPPQQESEQ